MLSVGNWQDVCTKGDQIRMVIFPPPASARGFSHRYPECLTEQLKTRFISTQSLVEGMMAAAHACRIYFRQRWGAHDFESRITSSWQFLHQKQAQGSKMYPQNINAIARTSLCSMSTLAEFIFSCWGQRCFQRKVLDQLILIIEWNRSCHQSPGEQWHLQRMQVR